MKLAVSLSLLVCAAVVTGCATHGDGSYRSENVTDTILSEGNYAVVKPGAEGTSRGFKLLGIPIVRPSHSSARSDLYEDVEEPLTGRAIALTNQREEPSSLNFLLFQIPTIKVSADVIEFKEETAAATSE